MGAGAVVLGDVGLRRAGEDDREHSRSHSQNPAADADTDADLLSSRPLVAVLLLPANVGRVGFLLAGGDGLNDATLSLLFGLGMGNTVHDGHGRGLRDDATTGGDEASGQEHETQCCVLDLILHGFSP